jgi:hypothetical protein
MQFNNNVNETKTESEIDITKINNKLVNFDDYRIKTELKIAMLRNQFDYFQNILNEEKDLLKNDPIILELHSMAKRKEAINKFDPKFSIIISNFLIYISNLTINDYNLY